MAEVDVNFMEEIRSFPVIWDRYATDFKNKHKKGKCFSIGGGKIWYVGRGSREEIQ